MRAVLDNAAEIPLGVCQSGATISFADFSRRETDDFGVTTVVKRGFSRRLSARLAIPLASVDAIARDLAELRATPARWVAAAGFDWLSFRGFFREFEIDYANGVEAYCSLTVEGFAEHEDLPDSGADPAPAGGVSTLQVIQPATIEGAALVSSTATENDYPEWNAATPYPLGARVIKAATHRIYESTLAHTGEDPAANAGAWVNIGPVNRWAMFDQALGTSTSANGSLEVVIAAPGSDGLALLDLAGVSGVRVRRTGYDRTAVPNEGGSAIFLDLPPGSGAVTVTLTGPGALSVGTLAIGKIARLGSTTDGARAGITDYSRKEFDDFGEALIVQRAWAKRMTLRSFIASSAVDMVANRIATVRATPCVWIGKSGMETLTVYGFCKDFSIEVDAPISRLNLTIEGLSTAGKIEPIRAGVDWDEIGDPTGTKPEDGATVGAPIGTDVGGRNAETVVSDLDLNALSILQQALRQDHYLTVLDARTLIEGQSIGVLFENFRTEQIGDNEALGATLALLGAKTPDGTAWVLDLSKVRVSGNETLAQRFTEIGSASRSNADDIAALDLTVAGQGSAITDQGAYITELRETLTGPDGSLARAIMALNVNGHVTGLVQTNDGTIGDFTIVADRFRLIDPNGGSPFTPLFYENNVWKLSNVEVDTLRINSVYTANLRPNAVTDGDRIQQATPVNGGSSFARVVYYTLTIPAGETWRVNVITTGYLGFPSGDATWELYLAMGGETVQSGGGMKTADLVTLSGQRTWGPGSYEIGIHFRGSSSVSCNQMGINLWWSKR